MTCYSCGYVYADELGRYGCPNCEGDKNPHAVALGRRGGRVKSQAKAAAARANGVKGGRPRKPVAKSRIPNGWFLHDRHERGLDGPTVLRKTKKHAWIADNDPALAELVRDARRYSHPSGPTRSPVWLINSARFFLKALTDQGVAL